MIAVSDASTIDEAHEALRRGELIVYPTDTLYGLGCLADREEAVQHLLDVTGRPPDKGLSAMFASLDRARAWSAWTPVAESLAEAFLPGPLTLILQASKRAPESIRSGQDTIGIRHVDREATNQLAQLGPVVSTSANPSGDQPPATIEEARAIFGDEVAAYVDAGRLDGPASTVVDARSQRGTVIREGPIPEDEILEATARGR